MPTYNSASQNLLDFFNTQNNALEILRKFSEAISTSKEVVKLEMVDEVGNKVYFEIPSFGFLKNEIKRIDENITSLSGDADYKATIKNPDGSFRRIIESQILTEPAKINDIVVPSTFNKKSNWFFESFLNPLLYVNLDLTGKIPEDTKKLVVKKIIVNCEDDQEIAFFNQEFKGKNELEYERSIQLLQDAGIGYFSDDEIVDMPISIMRYSGDFDVISKVEVEVQEIVNSVMQTTKRIKFRLNKLTYTDNLESLTNTKTLKIGDQLIVGKNSKFEITNVDTSENSIVIKRVSGYEVPTIGTSVFSMYSEMYSHKEAQVNVGFDNRVIIFLKPVEDKFNVASRYWSLGVGLYTNELNYTSPTGIKTLAEFYRNEVLDFGSVFLSFAKEKQIPAVYGEIPEVPTLVADNFKVINVNAHKLDDKELDEIKKKVSEKVNLQAEINQLDTSINQKKVELSTKKFNSDNERKSVKNDLDNLVREKVSKSSLYASIINELSTISKDIPASLDKAKYRIRGFWPVPPDKVNAKTGPQKIIQFIIQYRYLKKDGNAKGTDQITFTDVDGKEVRGYFSDWIEVKSNTKRRDFSDISGIYEWIDENVQDADSININQLDIPISKGEQVEIKIKSVSEAGYPANPVMSDWSTSVTIPFPPDLDNQNNEITFLNEAVLENTRVKFQEELNSKGLDLHLSSSLTTADKYFAHDAVDIASGFFTPENVIINLYDKLLSLEKSLTALQEKIANAKGALSVFILDDEGNKIKISNNSKVNLFAGYYSEIVQSLPTSEQKGHVVNKVYNLVVQNDAVSVLELMSRVSGGIGQTLPDSSIPSNGLQYGEDYLLRRWDKAPIVLNSLLASQTTNDSRFHPTPWQSSQVRSQWMYLRRVDITMTDDLYTQSDNIISSDSVLSPILTGTTQPWVWAFNTNTGGGNLSEFCVHIDHPLFASGTAGTTLNNPTPSSVSPAVYPIAWHAVGFNKESSEANGIKQLEWREPNISLTNGLQFPNKLGFHVNDRYLIGKNTTGSYLFIAPNGVNDISTEGNFFRSTKKVESGENNAIQIPVIFQFRMVDYYGTTATSGIVGGFDPASTVQKENLTYTKKLGFDIFVKDDDPFSFDIEVTSKYKKEGLSQILPKNSVYTISQI